MPSIEQGRYDEFHEVFTPREDDAVLWRYMDLTKLLALLEDQALHFTRGDLLGDPFEGSITTALANAEAAEYGPDASGKITKLTEAERKLITEWWQANGPLREKFRRWTWVSCWNHSPVESDALWGKYVHAGHGIAIRSTFGRVARCFGEPLTSSDKQQHPPQSHVYIGKVSYVDYEHAEWPANNMLWPFVHKRLSFAHEAEIRALVSASPSDGDYSAETHEGRLLAVNLDTLIEAAYVSPVAPPWLFSLVQRVCRRYGVQAEVRQSELSAAPTF